jgi:hypothetical protein
MEKIVIKQEVDNQEPERFESGEKMAHREAVEFVARHKDFLDHYAKGQIQIEPAPEGLNTFAFDLKKDTIYVNSMFYKERGLSEAKTAFAMCHEIEHFMEKSATLREVGGEKVFGDYVEKIKKSEAFGILDNCVADIRENKAVIGKTNRDFAELEQKMYKEDLFKEIDFTSAPKHIQFPQALLREARVLGEECIVAPEVRAKLDHVYNMTSKNGRPFLDIMTDPSIPMSARLKLQERYLEPIVKELLEEDLKDREEEQKKREKQEQGGGEGEAGENGEQENSESSDGKQSEGEGQSGNQNDKGNEGESTKEAQSQKSKQNKKGQGSGKPTPEKSSSDSARSGKIDPNEIFKADYEKVKEKFPEAMPIEELEKALKEWQESGGGTSESDTADAEYAKKLGTSKEAIKNYAELVKKVNGIVNPETNERVVDELRALFSRVISKRVKKNLMPKYPTEEGDYLVDPALLVAEARVGNFEPKVWESLEWKDKQDKHFGAVEFSIVCDRSGSMEGAKQREQQKAVVMVMEALKEFMDMVEEDKVNTITPLSVSSEVYSFQGDSGDKIPLKKMSDDFSEKERIVVAEALSTTDGSTTDYVVLEEIAKNLTDEMIEKMRDGEMKKIVVVMTDGESDNTSRVQAVLKKLKESHVVVVGIGITRDGESALTTYAPDARLSENASDLSTVLADVLKDHLKAV